MPRIVVTGKDVEPVYLDRLRTAGFEIHNPTEHLSEDEVIDHLADADAYFLAGLERATTRVVQGAPDSLRLIAFLGVGYESFVDSAEATRRGIAVTNTPGTMVPSVVEMTVGLLLALRRDIVAMNAEIKRGDVTEPRKTSDLEGRTVGIVGAGAIGSRVGRVLHDAFGMTVIYHSRSAKPDLEADADATKVDLPELLDASDVVSVHAQTTPETIGMIGASEFARMKEDALLINTARAELVDGRALAEALRSGAIAGAAFDGYYKEPLPSPDADEWGLLSLPDRRFIITPHVASLTSDSWNRMTEAALTNIEAFFKDESAPNVVNPDYQAHRV